MTDEKKLGRREFLKMAIASAAAAGLSHFQFLNFGGAELARAQDDCNPPGGVPDTCVPENQDPDMCWGPQFEDEDVCRAPQDPDECDPLGQPQVDTCLEVEPDACNPPQDPDRCLPDLDQDMCLPPDDPDQCWPDYGDQDSDEVCAPPNLPDICEGNPPTFDPDMCQGPSQPPDVCLPPVDPDAPPTAVEMASFSAGWTRQGVVVEWETANEVDSLGFNLYRSLAARSGYQQINASLIPCQSPGAPQGTAYSYLDGQAQPNTVYYYVIESLDAQGRADRYGPVLATPLRRLLPTRRRPGASRPDFESR